MNTIDEALKATKNENINRCPKPINDVYIIDPNTRSILSPSTELVLGVESDDKSERKHFKVSRFVGNNVDLSTLSLRVNYRNAAGDTDQYIVDDVDVDIDDCVTFSWVLSRKVTLFKGDVKFIICGVETDSQGTVTVKWNTTICKGIVLEGIEVENPEILPSDRDVIEQLLNLVKSEGSNQVALIQGTGNEQIARLENYTDDFRGKLDQIDKNTHDITTKITLPGTPEQNQILSGDGNGGVMWRTLYNAEEVKY